MNDGGHFTSAKYLVDRRFIADVGMPKDERSPADFLYTFERGLVAVGEIVNCDDIESGVQQRDADLGPDVM